MAISPLAPVGGFPKLPHIGGVRFAAAEAGVKYTGRLDVMLAEIAPGSSLAGVFTRSSTRSAPVLRCQENLAAIARADPSKPLAILVNSGNSNAFTGGHGVSTVDAVETKLAETLNCPRSHIFTASTGVIGERLPTERITDKIEELAANLSPANGEDAAHAIMTTDTFAKGASTKVTLSTGEVTIAGFAKGSGMIAPDMATMLGYVFTDARVEQSLLQDLLTATNQVSFNAITVDSDTSTSDTVLLAATGASGVSVTGDDIKIFATALKTVMQNLAHQIVRDGEGASKFIEVVVKGAQSDASATTVARAIANSPLVKTAIAGEDPNWGRVVMAVGKSGQPADRDLLSIWFGDILVADKGWVAESYSEEAGAAYMKADELTVTADLGIGSGTAQIWTCDLTHGYITINADYRS